MHGLYRERYAYRDYMTDVVVQHMVTEQTARIRCKGYVKKIAIYKERLAVAIGGPDRLHLYELKEGANDESEEMVYKNKEKLPLDMSGERRCIAPPPTTCLLYTSPSPRDQRGSRMPSSA